LREDLAVLSPTAREKGKEKEKAGGRASASFLQSKTDRTPGICQRSGHKGKRGGKKRSNPTGTHLVGGEEKGKEGHRVRCLQTRRTRGEQFGRTKGQEEGNQHSTSPAEGKKEKENPSCDDGGKRERKKFVTGLYRKEGGTIDGSVTRGGDGESN